MPKKFVVTEVEKDSLDASAQHSPSPPSAKSSSLASSGKRKRRGFVYVPGQKYKNIDSAAKAHGTTKHKVWYRLKAGWSLEAALNLELPQKSLEEASAGQGRSPIYVNGVLYETATAAARAFGVSPKKYWSRVGGGWTPKQALGLDSPPNDGPCFGRIYAITHLATGKQYIGLTRSTLENRWHQHIHKAGRLKHTNPDSLQAAILRYGPEAFTICQLTVAYSKNELADLEREMITEYRTLAPEGFNLKKGGEGLNANKSGGINLIVGGIRYSSIAAACSALGASEKCVRSRLKKGETPDKAFSRPGKKTGPTPVVFQGIVYPTVKSLAETHGIHPKKYQSRRDLGWSIEEALSLVCRRKESPSLK